MNYRYSNELDITASIDITLHDLDRLIDILKPIAADDMHEQCYRAADLKHGLEEIRTRLTKQTRSYLTARADILNK